MVQIEKRKKKGRPSKADLAARRAAEEADAGVSPSAASSAEPRDVRRSLRRKSFRYNIIDYDEDYLDEEVSEEDEDEEEEDEEEGEDGGNSDRRRRGKKVKLVVKLNNNDKTKNRNSRTSRGSVSRQGRAASGDSEEEEEEEEVEEEEREVKKRRINGGGDEEDEDEEFENGENDDDDEGRDEKEEQKERGYVPGNRNKYHDGNTPLPDKKQLVLILDKLQKKDTYGVYADPVDPEELPDYHEVIEHPMDFSTVRKKLGNGAYFTLEQFEGDIFLICSNAMQYNAPETIYHKQARAIKELAEKKFQRIRMQIERIEEEPKSESKYEPKLEPKSEQKDRSYSLVKKQTKKLFCRGMQEHVGSDFSSGATLATVDPPNTGSTAYVDNSERPIHNDGPVEGFSFLVDNNLERAEDPQSGKGVLPKFGKRSFLVDENRRATYNLSNQPEDRCESIYDTFDSEKKQLIPVGLSGELSYARSLARYAANLGPMAWRIASKRIEQVLPPGLKYGRGWIGDCEPLHTSVIFFERRKDPVASRLHDLDLRKDDRKDHIVSKVLNAVDTRTNEKVLGGQAQANVHLFNQPNSAGKLATIFGSGGAKPPASTVAVSQHQKQHNSLPRGSDNMMFKGAELNCPSANSHQYNAVFQNHSRLQRDTVCAENMGAKRVEPNSPSISDQKRDCSPQKQLSMEIGKKRVEANSLPTADQKTENSLQKPPHAMGMPASMPCESLPKGKNFLQSLPFKQPDANGGAPEGLSNGKVANNFVASNRVISSSVGLVPPQLAGAASSFPQRQDQGLSDPVLVMKMLTEKAQRQQNGSIHSPSPAQARPSVLSPRGETGGNAAAAAASAWMSVGSAGLKPPAQNPLTNRSQIAADSLYNATRVFYPQAMQSHAEYPVSAAMHFKPEKTGLPFQGFTSQPTKVGNEAQVPSRPMVFPQLVTNDLSRFQVQAPWRGLSPSTHTQQKQKQDTLPPDLNVAFQSSVDSQQPDLALQL